MHMLCRSSGLSTITSLNADGHSSNALSDRSASFSFVELSRRLEIQEGQLTAITKELEEAILLRSKLETENDEYTLVHSCVFGDLSVADKIDDVSLTGYVALRKRFLDDQLHAILVQQKMKNYLSAETDEIKSSIADSKISLEAKRIECLMRVRHPAGILFLASQTGNILLPRGGSSVQTTNNNGNSSTIQTTNSCAQNTTLSRILRKPIRQAVNVFFQAHHKKS